MNAGRWMLLAMATGALMLASVAAAQSGARRAAEAVDRPPRAISGDGEIVAPDDIDAPAEDETPRRAGRDTTPPDPAALIVEALADAESKLKEIEAEIAELTATVQELDPAPEAQVNYRTQRLRLGTLVAQRAAWKHNIETFTLMQKWQAGDRSLAPELARRVVRGGTALADDDLAAVEENATPDTTRAVSIWQAAFVEVVPTPVWSSSSGRSAEPGALPQETRGARGGPSMGRSERGRSPYGGSPYGAGAVAGGGAPATAEDGEEATPAGQIQVNEGVRFTSDPAIQPRLAAAQRKFRDTVQSTDRRVATGLREPLTVLRQIERADRATAALATRYRTQWRRFEANERQATQERADQERITQTREMLRAELQRAFGDACRALVDDGRVLPLVEAMLAEEGSDVAEEFRSTWGEPGAPQSDRRVVGAFLPKPEEPAAVDSVAEAPAAGDTEPPAEPGAAPPAEERPPGRHPGLPPHYRIP